MGKLQCLSLRMSQVSGKGKHAANDNCNVLNDFCKKRIRCCGRWQQLILPRGGEQQIQVEMK